MKGKAGRAGKENMSLSELRWVEENILGLRILVVKYQAKRLNGKSLALEVEMLALMVICCNSASDFHQLCQQGNWGKVIYPEQLF